MMAAGMMMLLMESISNGPFEQRFARETGTLQSDALMQPPFQVYNTRALLQLFLSMALEAWDENPSKFQPTIEVRDMTHLSGVLPGLNRFVTNIYAFYRSFGSP
jgi:hypothetical protein